MTQETTDVVGKISYDQEGNTATPPVNSEVPIEIKNVAVENQFILLPCFVITV